MKLHNIIISITFASILYSCESVKSVEGVVIDINKTPLDSVLVSDNTINRNILTDSLGRFKYIRMGPVRQGLDIKFSFSKKGFINHSQTIKINTSTKVVIIMKKDETK